MIVQEEGEARGHYLARVLLNFMETSGTEEFTIDYDDTTCDFYCLANEIANELGYIDE